MRRRYRITSEFRSRCSNKQAQTRYIVFFNFGLPGGAEVAERACFGLSQAVQLPKTGVRLSERGCFEWFQRIGRSAVNFFKKLLMAFLP